MQMSVHITDVSVDLAQQDQRYAGLCDTEQLGYVGLSHSPLEFANGDDFLVIKHLLEKSDSSIPDGVSFVGAVIYPFEVIGEAIRLHTIDMIDHRQIIWVRDECHRYNAMEEEVFALSVFPHAELAVAGFGMDVGSENLTIHSSGLQPVTYPIQTSDASEVTDLVEISEVCDRNRSPFFNESDIHVAGLLSGNDGWTIKNPLHASTFGGFAIMAAYSDAYNRRLPYPSH